MSEPEFVCSYCKKPGRPEDGYRLTMGSDGRWEGRAHLHCAEEAEREIERLAEEALSEIADGARF